MKVATLLLALLTLPFASHAADARSLSPKRVTIETDEDPVYGSLSVQAEVSKRDDWRRIEVLTIHWQGSEIKVPAEIFADLRAPDLATLRFSVWMFDSKLPHLFVSFRLDDPDYNKRVGKPAVVQLAIHGARVISRTITWFTEAGKERNDKRHYKA